MEKENRDIIYPLLFANITFLALDWWRIYIVFYIFCGDNMRRWKIALTIYYLCLILFGYIIGWVLQKKKILCNPQILIVILMLMLMAISIYRLFRFFVLDIY